MAQRYDAVVIGGGHNGLVTAAYLAKAGRSVVVLERRHVLGGGLGGDRARLPLQRVLLRRLAPAPRDHPRARAPEARPRDPPARRDDHAAGRRLAVASERPRSHGPRAPAVVVERRGGLRGVRAADGRDGPLHQADPLDRAAGSGVSVRDWLPLTPLAKTFKDLPKRLQTTFIQLMTMSAADFLDQWFETEPLKATMSASGIIGTFQGRARPGRPMSCSTTTWERSTARSARGACRAAGPGASPRRSVVPRRRTARRSGWRRRWRGSMCAAIAPRASRSSRGADRGCDGALLLDSRWTFIKLLEDGVLEPAFRDEVLRYKYRGSSGR